MKGKPSLYNETVKWYNTIVGDANAAQLRAGMSGGEAAINTVLSRALIDLRKTVGQVLDEETQGKISRISSQMSAKGAASFARSGKGESRRSVIKSIGRLFGVAESPSDFFEKQYLEVKKLQKEMGVDSRTSSASTVSDSGSRSSSDGSDLTTYAATPVSRAAPAPTAAAVSRAASVPAVGGSIKDRAAAIDRKLKATPDVVGLVDRDTRIAAATGSSLGQVWKEGAAAETKAARERLAGAATSLPKAPASTPAKGGAGGPAKG